MEKPLTAAFRQDGEMLSIEEYEYAGGYQAARRAIRELTPKEVQQMVTASNLRGRGGAGFPTGVKWSFVPMGDHAPHPKYVISNSDEMEPGAFKDRLLMEQNPHQLIEGMIISAYAVEADVGYIFLRWAYGRSDARLKRALTEAYSRGYLGRSIFDSHFSLEMRVHTSAGRYICGEETALLNALEGKRAIPRDRPPYPQVSGLWGQPTVVNNAETISSIPHIILRGPEWFKKLSLTACGGTKLYTVSGRVKRPGWWELPMGVTMRELIEEHAGGMKDGYSFRSVIPGGGSTEFVPEDKLDVRMDFDEMAKAGSRLGTGTMLVLDDKTCPIGVVGSLQRFFSRESCGWCTPCREGLPWVVDMLDAIENGHGQPRDIEILEEHTRLIAPHHTYCALAPGAMEPLASALKYFRDDFEQHIRERRCPYRSG
jgi:NADH-quinone oxidoreductase subunit F